MKFVRLFLLFLVGFCLVGTTTAQQSAQPAAAPVPRLVNFSGRVNDAQGKAVPGMAGITFSIYRDQYDGAALWMETQNVQADARGNYTVQLGATRSEGLPLELFTSGEARWLGVRVNGQEEQPRVLLLSVPYALKAADAATIGGLPPSAFMLVPSVHADVTTISAGTRPATPSARLSGAVVPSTSCLSGRLTVTLWAIPFCFSREPRWESIPPHRLPL